MTGFKVGRLGFIGRGIARRLGNTVRHGHLISQQLISRRSIFHHPARRYVSLRERYNSPVSPDSNIRVSHRPDFPCQDHRYPNPSLWRVESENANPNDAESGRPPCHRPHFREEPRHESRPPLHCGCNCRCDGKSSMHSMHSIQAKVVVVVIRHVPVVELGLRRSPPPIECASVLIIGMGNSRQ